MAAGPTDVAVSRTLLPLEVGVRKQLNGPILCKRQLSKAELSEFVAEVWHRTFLRKGFPNVPLDAIPVEMVPIHQAGEVGPLAGFAIKTVNPAGDSFQVRFTVRAVQQTALQMAHELVGSGHLQPEDEYHYELTLGTSDERHADDVQQLDDDCNVTITTQAAPLKYVNLRLAPLLSRSQAVGPQDNNLSQVFYTAKAVETAEKFARQGGNHQPPIETGCIEIGTLGACPKTGEFFVIVTDVLEAQDAQSKKLSLEFTGKTWHRVQAILRAKQAQPTMQTLRFLGQAHGHPFLPQNGAPPCEACWQQKECPRHSCFVSVDDNKWSRAVFPRQPWQLCHIFGLNARGEHVNKLFGQYDGTLVERGYRVLPDFDLATITNDET